MSSMSKQGAPAPRPEPKPNPQGPWRPADWAMI